MNTESKKKALRNKEENYVVPVKFPKQVFNDSDLWYASCHQTKGGYMVRINCWPTRLARDIFNVTRAIRYVIKERWGKDKITVSTPIKVKHF